MVYLLVEKMVVHSNFRVGTKVIWHEHYWDSHMGQSIDLEIKTTMFNRDSQYEVISPFNIKGYWMLTETVEYQNF